MAIPGADVTSGRFATRFQGGLAAGSPSRGLIEAMLAGDDPISRVETTIQAAGGA
jgi:hypothetical protein